MTQAYDNRPQVESIQYFRPEYCSPERMASFGCQFREVMSFRPNSVLEVGCGAGILKHLLCNAGVRTMTVDLDQRLSPDVCASVLALPFREGCFDVVACFQVLEHLPYTLLVSSVRELARVARKAVVLSLPDVSRYVAIDLEIPRMSGCRWELPIALPGRRHAFNGQHHWEMGWRDTPARLVIKDIRAAGLRLQRHFRARHLMYHHFFVLEIPAPSSGRPISQ